MTKLEMLRTWGGERDAFEVTRGESSGADAWNAVLTTTELSGHPGLKVEVRAAAHDDRVSILCARAIPAAASKAAGAQELGRAVEAVGLACPGVLRCALVEDAAGSRVEVRSAVYPDGFTRDALNQRIADVAKAARAVDERVGALAETARLVAEAEGLMKDDDARVARYEAELEQRGATARAISATLREAEARASASPATAGTCPGCGAAHPPGSRFCGKCGAALGCSSCGAANPPGMRFCVQCGAELARPSR